jgi:hypothetical protein
MLSKFPVNSGLNGKLACAWGWFYMPNTLQLKGVCMCVCVCLREREREREDEQGYVYIGFEPRLLASGK